MRPAASHRALGVALALLCLPLPGCFYELDSPVGTPASATLDPKLLGEWRCLSGSDDKPALLRFQAFDATQYSVLVESPDEPGSQMRAFSTGIQGVLNVQDVDDRSADARKWGLARYRLLGPDTLDLLLPKGDALRGVAPADLPELLRKRLDDATFFESTVVCGRATRRDRPAF